MRGFCVSRGAIVRAIADASVRGQIATIGIGVAVAASVVIETKIVGPESKAETPVVIETPVVTEMTARPGKVMTCKAAAEASNAAAHMAATEAATHVAATEATTHVAATEAATHMAATEAATTAAARKRVSGQSPCENGGRR
jgi:hypothetical protein